MSAFYDLPTTVTVGGKTVEIRSDFRAALDIIAALSDKELTDSERAYCVLKIFYVDDVDLDYAQEAIDKCMWFLSVGENNDNKKSPKLMDWEQDFQYIVAPINKAVGRDVRSMPYMHWWTFVGYYNEIGECMFSNIVGVRKKLKSGKKLDKSDREFYIKNKKIVDFKVLYTSAEESLLNAWGGK